MSIADAAGRRIGDVAGNIVAQIPNAIILPVRGRGRGWIADLCSAGANDYTARPPAGLIRLLRVLVPAAAAGALTFRGSHSSASGRMW